MNIDHLKALKGMAFSLTTITEKNCFAGWKLNDFKVTNYLIIYVTKGRGSIQINKKHYHLEKNKCFLCVPGMNIDVASDLYDPLQFYELFFVVEMKNDHQIEKNTFPFKGEVPIRNSLEVLKLIRESHETAHELSYMEEFRKNVLLHQLIYLLTNNIYQKSENTDIGTAIQTTKEYIDKYYDQDLSRETLANMVGVSADYFSHQFKKHVGVSPNEYLTQIRVNQAKKNLITSNQRLKGVAKSVGYSDEFYFSRLFKKVVGVSPTVYVRKNRKKIVTLSYAFCSDMLALGVKPYATLAYKDGKPKPHAFPYLSETIYIDVSNSTCIDSTSIQPDLFICEGFNGTIGKGFYGSAPTIQIPWKELDWRTHFHKIAKIIEKEKEAEHWLIDYEKKAEKAGEQIRNVVKDETVLILYIHDGECFIYGNRNIGAVIYQDLKLNSPYDMQKINHSKKIAMEELPLFDADHILLMVDDDESSKGKFNSLVRSEQWQSLKGTQKNQFYFIDKSLWLEYSALSHEKIIDKAVAIFSR